MSRSVPSKVSDVKLLRVRKSTTRARANREFPTNLLVYVMKKAKQVYHWLGK